VPANAVISGVSFSPDGKRLAFTYEAHGYTGRESVLHTLAEMINWFDKYVKNAGPRVQTAADH
jgi:WD40-like Beta Propeller Repeat